eukprot:TRINITY_DN7278_c0_g1_i1.p1 TRINITY_DN7278_c0_g1~~TRINITY_DN7278_c0_g1_i1.p1  ORF type:complete len:179 (+),score=35.26 TRINITY_DN7278_c0_g1_i1:122-658(+)
MFLRNSLTQFKSQKSHTILSKRSFHFQEKITKYTKTPCPLFRIQTGSQVNLRVHDEQKKAGRVSYDLKLYDGLVKPLYEDGETEFIRPNGMSLRPKGNFMTQLVMEFRGRNIEIKMVPEGTPIPEGLVLIHEHTDHFAMQTTKPVSIDEFNKKLTEFMAPYPIMDKNEFLDNYSTFRD